jgi:hypothetical protein
MATATAEPNDPGGGAQNMDFIAILAARPSQKTTLETIAHLSMDINNISPRMK